MQWIKVEDQLPEDGELIVLYHSATEDIEIIQCTEKARINIQQAPSWKV